MYNQPLSACGLGVLAALMALSAGPVWAQDPIHAWRYNSYGVPGLVDMPAAHSREDGELAGTMSYFSSQPRGTLTFQVSDRLSASFRYLRYLRRPEVVGRPVGSPPQVILDRSFSFHYRFMDEGDYFPAMSVGMNDIGGTGHFGAEYVVASKTISPRLRVTGGIGWGRLGSYNGFTNPLGVFKDAFETRPGRQGSQGGTLQAKSWFRGDAALFGGVEWQVSDRLQLTAEYSSDAYYLEDGASFDRKSPFNFGVTWAASPNTQVSASYLYGSELGVQVSFALNPKRSPQGSGRDPAPVPVRLSGAREILGWGDIQPAMGVQGLERALDREGIDLIGLVPKGRVLEMSIRNTRYSQSVQAVGRAARILSHFAGPEVAQFDIILTRYGMPVTRVALSRADLERLETAPVASDLMRAGTRIHDQSAPIAYLPKVYPNWTGQIAPYALPSFFDPDSPFRIDFGVAASMTVEPLPGLVLSGKVQHKLAGNLDKGDRPSDSVLPHVRSDSYLYFQGPKTTLQNLTAAYYFRPGPDLFGRVTLGYLEMMYAGASAELLWKPQNSALALGVEVNQLRQRSFDQDFGLRDYKVASGHVSAYYEAGGGYRAQLDVGRYLAGDTGLTLTLGRSFDNGWRIDGFATKTNVSSQDFGEGSFDKGIRLEIPLDWVRGRPSQQKLVQVLRPVQRDGGARVHVPGRLYEGLRGLQASEIDGSWGRFWK